MPDRTWQNRIHCFDSDGDDVNQDYVWVIDDDRSIRWVLEKAFKQANMHVTCFESADDALELVRSNAIPPDVIISDVRMPGSDGFALLKQLKQQQNDTPVLIMTAFSDLDSTVSAFDGGAYEYISKPFDVDEVIAKAQRASQAHRENRAQKARTLKKNVATQNPLELKAQEAPELLGDSPAMQEVFTAIGRLSRSKITVLINGESGTGKELIARALHRHSPRSDKPFIALNMAAIPNDLMESELFGHEKGAFTGAQAKRIGRFEQADGGTLFLDEIGDMPATLQTRLLRVLADGQFYRVGGHAPIAVDVRIVAASHQNLEAKVQDQSFREDLFHRLNVIRIEAPPLRERQSDIPKLMDHFLKQAAEELQEDTKLMSMAFKRHIVALPWPGNVRQLQNTAHWLTVMAVNRELTPDDLPKESQTPSNNGTDSWKESFKNWATESLRNGESDLLGKAVPTVERILIRCALEQTRDKKQEAAKLLGWGRNTLTRKIKELGLEEQP